MWSTHLFVGKDEKLLVPALQQALDFANTFLIEHPHSILRSLSHDIVWTSAGAIATVIILVDEEEKESGSTSSTDHSQS